MKNIFKLSFLLVIGLISLITTFHGVSTTKVYSEGGRVEATKFDLSMFDPSGQLLFSMSPLNDYYYHENLRDHLLNTVTESVGGPKLEEARVSFERLIFGKERILWNMSGRNIRGEAGVSFDIRSNGRRITVVRRISNKGQVSSVGTVVNFCQSCLIADEGKRLYFNGDLLTEEKISVAEKLGFTPIVLGENQSFPTDGKNILFLNREGKTLFRIPVGGNEIFLQEQWHLLEFKKSVDSMNLTQEIYIENL